MCGLRENAVFVEDALELPGWLMPNPPATFLRRVAGSSKESAGIYDRDLACVDRSLMTGHGSIVVAAIDGRMSYKRLLIAGNGAPRLLQLGPARVRGRGTR